MEHQVGVVGLGHGFAQGSDGPKAEEEALEGSQVQILVSQCSIMPNPSCSDFCLVCDRFLSPLSCLWRAC